MAQNQSDWAHFRYELVTAIALAFDSIRAHKLRSFLTLLGVIIGVASVILVGSAIEGLGVYAQQSTAKAFGTESYLVAQVASAGNMSRREYFDRLRSNRPITIDEFRFLRDINKDNSIYSPYRQSQVDFKRDNLIQEDSSVIGSAAALADIRDIGIVSGRFFTDQEEKSRAFVAVIGDDTRVNLFPEGSPLGKAIKIKGIDFTVIGLQEKLGAAFGVSRDKSAYIPITSFNRLFGPGNGFALFARAKPDTKLSMQESLDLTRVALRTRFHERPGQKDRFDTLTPDSIRGFVDQVLGMISVIVVPVTLISLVVGGIVIMNIMLVSVTERTREIGIRKALGARRFTVLLQILVESIMLSSFGGLMGIAIGALLTFALGKAFDLTLHITLAYVALSIGVSSAVGLISGWYPASRASKLDPIEALRSE
jgi:putative ABC transport system permease protein